MIRYSNSSYIWLGAIWISTLYPQVEHRNWILQLELWNGTQDIIQIDLLTHCKNFDPRQILERTWCAKSVLCILQSAMKALIKLTTSRLDKHGNTIWIICMQWLYSLFKKSIKHLEQIQWLVEIDGKWYKHLKLTRYHVQWHPPQWHPTFQSLNHERRHWQEVYLRDIWTTLSFDGPKLIRH